MSKLSSAAILFFLEARIWVHSQQVVGQRFGTNFDSVKALAFKGKVDRIDSYFLGETVESNGVTGGQPYLTKVISISGTPKIASLNHDKLDPSRIQVRLNGSLISDDVSQLFKLFTLLGGDASKYPKSVSVTQALSTIQGTANSNKFDFIYLDKVSTSAGFYGRKQELLDLNGAMLNPDTKLVFVHAFGGEGKTALIKHWKDQVLNLSTMEIECGFAFSFYNQGQSEPLPNSSPFFRAAFEFFERTPPNNPDLRIHAEELERLCSVHRLLLIIDGIEVMQYAPEENRDKRIRDAGFEHFLMRLAGGSFQGTCVVTTRYVPENFLYKEPIVFVRELDRLSIEDGRELVVKAGVAEGLVDSDGHDSIERLVNEYDGHALALVLIANYLFRYHAGDPRRRKLSGITIPDTGPGRHARKVLQKYVSKLTSMSHVAEISILNAMSIFDRPVKLNVVSKVIVKVNPVISAITHPFLEAIENLQRMGLISIQFDDADMHPLVRAFFRDRLKQFEPQLWRTLNEGMFEWLLVQSKPCLSKFTDSTHSVASLNKAESEVVEGLSHLVHHACEAGFFWHAHAIVTCRIDESFPSNQERALRWIFRLWSVISQSRWIEQLSITFLNALGKHFHFPPFGKFYRNQSELHATIGFYLGSHLQGWDLRMMISSCFYPHRDFSKRPLLVDTFFSSHVDLCTGYCCAALGYTQEAIFVSERAFENLRRLGVKPLAFIPGCGLAIIKMLVGRLHEATTLADECLKLAVLSQQEADILTLRGYLLSIRGMRDEAELDFDRALKISPRISTRVAQLYWEHVIRFYSFDDAEKILNNAASSPPQVDPNNSHVSWETVRIRSQLDLDYRQAAMGKGLSARELRQRMDSLFEKFTNYHFEGAFYRAQTMLQQAKISVLCAIQDASDATSLETAFQDIASAERLASFGNYRLLSIDTSIEHARLLLHCDRNTEGHRKVLSARSEAIEIGYAWGMANADTLISKTSHAS